MRSTIVRVIVRVRSTRMICLVRVGVIVRVRSMRMICLVRVCVIVRVRSTRMICLVRVGGVRALLSHSSVVVSFERCRKMI